MGEYIGEKPAPARLAQLRAHRQQPTRPPETTSQRQHEALSQRQISPSLYELNISDAEKQRINDAVARIFRRDRYAGGAHICRYRLC
jgi:hypothetical protein